MSDDTFLYLINSAQAVALAWIVAWQQRAAHERRKLNGSLERLIRNGYDPAPADDVDFSKRV